MWEPPGKLIIWRPYKLIFLELFWPKRRLEIILGNVCPNCR
jgi:hypothetical protein